MFDTNTPNNTLVYVHLDFSPLTLWGANPIYKVGKILWGFLFLRWLWSTPPMQVSP